MYSALISFISCYLFLIIFMTKRPRLSFQNQLIVLSASAGSVGGGWVVNNWFLT